MTLYCPRCRMSDDRWAMAIPALCRSDGSTEDVWRHKPCREMVAVPRDRVPA